MQKIAHFWLVVLAWVREGVCSAWDEGLNRLRPGFVPGAPRGQAWLLSLEMERAYLQQVEAPPAKHAGQEKRGGPLSVNTALGILPSPPGGPSACPQGHGTREELGMMREEGRRRALLGELMGCEW